MKSCWGYILLSWLLENVKSSGRYGEWSLADASRGCIAVDALEPKLERFTRKSSQLEPVTHRMSLSTNC